jgi:hypothetical protein
MPRVSDERLSIIINYKWQSVNALVPGPEISDLALDLRDCRARVKALKHGLAKYGYHVSRNCSDGECVCGLSALCAPEEGDDK